MASRKEYAGIGSLSEVRELLDHRGAERVFLVTGHRSYRVSGAAVTLARLLEGKTVVHFSDFPPSPGSEDLDRDLAFFRGAAHDIILAVGGGSVLDMAKMIKVCGPSEGTASQYILGKATLSDRGLPLIAIPTTAGTGSEVTQFAVVYINAAKYSMASKSMLPEHVVLDHALTESLPEYQIAATGADALAQAIEAYWSVNSTEESREYSTQAIKKIVPVLRRTIHDGTVEDRGRMLRGANLAGKAIDIARTTAPHTLSYSFSRKYGIAHGHAVGLTLGPIFEHNAEVTAGDACDARGGVFSRERVEELADLVGAGTVMRARACAESLMADLNLPTGLRDLRVERRDLAELARSVKSQRLANNPRLLPQEVIGRILESIY